MLSGIIFDNTHWTVWDLVLLVFVLIPFTILWVGAIIDIFANHAVKPVTKVLWLIILLVLPFIGVICYFIFRPTPPYVEMPIVVAPATLTEQLHALETMHHNGVLSEDELESLSGRLTPAQPGSAVAPSESPKAPQ